MITRQLVRALFALKVSVFALTLTLHAEEGGSGHYLQGSFSTMVDFPAEKPGLGVTARFVYYDADVSGTVALPFGGLLPVGLNAEAKIAIASGAYTFENKVLGGNYSVGLAVPLVDFKVTALVGGTGVSQTDSGVGDVILLPALLQWRDGFWQYGLIAAVYAPTGSYQAGRLANVGKNYWTFNPNVAVNYMNPKKLVEFSSFIGLDFNTENDDTDYRSGTQLHMEASALKHFAYKGALYGFGVNGFYYQQLADDSGSGATLGGFKGMTTGVGPVIRYLKATPERTVFAELKWLPELDTKRRLQGDFIWLKMGSTF